MRGLRKPRYYELASWQMTKALLFGISAAAIAGAGYEFATHLLAMPPSRGVAWASMTTIFGCVCSGVMTHLLVSE